MHNVSELSEIEKTILWVEGAYHQLQIRGLIGGASSRMTIKGLALWDQIDKEWKPRDLDLEGYLEATDQETQSFGLEGPMLTLLKDFRDKREKIIPKSSKKKQFPRV